MLELLDELLDELLLELDELLLDEELDELLISLNSPPCRRKSLKISGAFIVVCP